MPGWTPGWRPSHPVARQPQSPASDSTCLTLSFSTSCSDWTFFIGQVSFVPRSARDFYRRNQEHQNDGLTHREPSPPNETNAATYFAVYMQTRTLYIIHAERKPGRIKSERNAGDTERTLKPRLAIYEFDQNKRPDRCLDIVFTHARQ